MSRLCLITALPVESRALLDALKLRQAREKYLRLFESDRFLLLETGVGKLRAAAATAAMLQCRQNVSTIVNVGIAGGSLDYGQTVIAHHVRDAASGAQWYPHLPAATPFRKAASASVSTLDAPCTRYSDGVVFDMEAAGIFSAASTYLSTSQVHSIKVISDNSEHAIQGINKAIVTTLLQEAMCQIIPLLEVLEEQSRQQTGQPDVALEQFVRQTCSSVHHTINDEQQLRLLLQRRLNMTGHLPDIPASARTARDVRLALCAELAILPLNYGHS